MATDAASRSVRALHGRGADAPPTRAILKIVCFDDVDLAWAKDIAVAVARLCRCISQPEPRSRRPPICETRSASATAGCASASPQIPTSHARASCRNCTSSPGRTRPAYEPDRAQRPAQPRRGRDARRVQRPRRRSSRSSPSRPPTACRSCPTATSAPASRPQLPRRDPRRRARSIRDRLDHGLRRHQGGLQAAARATRPLLPERDRGPREPHQREPRPLDLGAPASRRCLA